jgi:tetratricopeptide (TPR) repeat protein
MKRSILFSAVALLSTLPLLGDQADDYYKAGMAAVSKGDINGARAAFQQTLKLKPNHPYARFQLGKLEGNKSEMIAKRRSNELASVKIPAVSFEGVTLSEALQALGALVDEQVAKAEPKSEFSPNFMVRDPKRELGQREVSLQLKNVPAKVALDYLLEQAGGVARFDEHATVISPAPQSAAR